MDQIWNSANYFPIFNRGVNVSIPQDETSPEKGSYSTSTRQSMEGKALVPKEIEQIEMMDENYKDHLQLLVRNNHEQ